MADNTESSWGRRTFLQATGALGSIAAVGGVATASSGGERAELLAGVSAATAMSTAESRAMEAMPDGASVKDRNENLGFIHLDVPKQAGTMDEETMIDELESRPGIAYAERNVRFWALETPDDPRFGEQYAPQQVNAPAAWDTTVGSSDVTIAVVDQGVKYDHPDLADRFDSVKGRDFVDGDDDPYPESLSEEYHGTHVAGIASATIDNGTGVAGMSNSTLLSARALGTSGGGSLAAIANAVEWAANQGADIINMSLGGGGYTDTMKNAVSYAVSNGALPICAAGNSASRPGYDGGVSYPAKYDECVAVGSLDSNEDRSDFSQYGPELDVVAPGSDVLSTWTERSRQYNRISGTSMACPAASGVAALGLAADPDLGPNDLRARLKDTTVDVGLPDREQGSGRVDAAKIVAAGDGGGGGGGDNEAPSVSIDQSAATVPVGEPVTFDGSGSSDPDGSVDSFEWEFGDGATATGATVEHAYGDAGDFTVSLTVTDDDGASTTDTVVVTVEEQGGGGDCGDERDEGSASDRLWGWWDGDRYTWSSDLENTCQVVVSLDGPSRADFDLYVTTDGSRPTTSNYDERSITQDSQEQIVLEGDLSEARILVDAYRGSGRYTVTAEELGK